MAPFKLAISLLTVLCAASVVHASTIFVKINGSAQPPSSSLTATARRVDANHPESRKLQLRVNERTDVNLGEGTWEITIASDLYWAAPAFASETQPATLQLWPRGSMRGTLGTSAPPSGELLVHFDSASADDRHPEPSGIVACPFANREWTCSLPAGVHDLRFSLSGFATEFRWSVNVAKEVTTIAPLDFTPGSSVFGKVQLAAREKADLRKGEISLQPRNADPRQKARRYSTKPDARGFFQLRGLAPGEYTLDAVLGDLTSDTRDVLIIGQTNASLKEPLVLAKPGRLDVRIHPPLDPQQKPWLVTLARSQSRNFADIIGASLASADGVWSHSKTLPGEYHLTVRQEEGGDWYDEWFTLTGTDRNRSIDVAVEGQRVQGTVMLGDRPLQAKIQFRDENGPALTTDEQGRFEGTLPRLKDDQATLFITSSTPDVQRTMNVKGARTPDGDLDFRIQLPATTILGRVVDEHGAPETNGIVRLDANGWNEFAQMVVREDGSFEFAGIAPGIYRLQADALGKASDIVSIDTANDATSNIEIVMRAEEQIKGLITMRGVPVSGAEVVAIPRDKKIMLGRNIVSDANGRFVATLPPGTRTYDIVVIPRGFYVTGGRITIDPKTPDLRIGVGQDGGSLTIDAPDDDSMLLLGYSGYEFSVEFLANASEGSVTRADGRRHMILPRLEPGPYSVCRNAKCANVYVPRLASASVSID